MQAFIQKISVVFDNYFKRIFTLDIRALALFRIFIAFVLIGDITVRLSDVEAFYSNSGVLPLGMLHQGNYFNSFSISLHAMNGSVWFQTFLFLVGYFCALCMLLGYQTRLFTFFSFLLLLSAQNRNVLVLQGGDDFLRLCLFWAIFLPTNRIWSLDSRGSNKPDTYSIYHIGNVGYIMLLFSVYFFTAIMKHSPEWYRDGTALYYAFSIDQMIYPPAKWLYPYPKVLQALTFGTIYLELIAPILLLIPFKPKLFKTLFVIGLTSLHLGIGLTMQVGYFFIISIAAMVGLWPRAFIRPFEQFFDWLEERRLPQLDSLKINLRQYRFPRLGIGIGMMAIIVSLIWNIGNVAKIPGSVRDVVRPIGLSSGLSQNWGMFAPTVFKADGWYVYEAVTEKGDTIDILKPNENLDYEKPEWAVFQYKNAKWRKLGENLIRQKNKRFRTPFCRYQLKKHNERHPDQKITELSVLYFQEKTLPDYEVDSIRRGNICHCALAKPAEKTTAALEEKSE